MKTLGKVLFLLVSLPLAGLLFWLWLWGGWRTVSWNQKLTVIVDTPAGEVAGSAVDQVTWWRGNKRFMPKLDNGGISLRGEATAVEVAPGRWLFVLLGGQENILYDSLNATLDGGWEGTIPEIPVRRPNLTLTPAQYPLLVTFDDIHDPKTVRQIDPDDLDAAFGCDRPLTPQQAPWRAEGRTYRDWAAERTFKLEGAEVAAKVGITGTAAEALVDYSWINRRDHQMTQSDSEKSAQLRTQFTQVQRDRWANAFSARDRKRNVTLPTLSDIAAPTGGPCYSLKGLRLAVTDEPVTDGKVEAFPFWPKLKQQVTFSGLQMFDPKRPDPLNYMNYDALLIKGSSQ